MTEMQKQLEIKTERERDRERIGICGRSQAKLKCLTSLSHFRWYGREQEQKKQREAARKHSQQLNGVGRLLFILKWNTRDNKAGC